MLPFIGLIRTSIINILTNKCFDYQLLYPNQISVIDWLSWVCYRFLSYLDMDIFRMECVWEKSQYLYRHSTNCLILVIFTLNDTSKLEPKESSLSRVIIFRCRLVWLRSEYSRLAICFSKEIVRRFFQHRSHFIAV